MHKPPPMQKYAVLTSLLLLLAWPALAQQKMVLGPAQFKNDASGSGAILCTWSIYLEIKTWAATCQIERKPVDDAIDDAILAIDDFIIANSSLHPTRDMLSEFKQRQEESFAAALKKRGLQKACSNPDLEHFRKPSPEAIQASVKSLLAVPREPVMNPCL